MGRLELEGFHATNNKNVDSIINEEFKIDKTRNDHWLGFGIYLFKYKIDATSWANGTYYCKDNPAIIKVNVEVEKNQYLDFDDTEEKNEFYRYFKEVLKKLSKHGRIITFKNEYQAMCFGLNIYKKDKNIDLIKHTFVNDRTRRQAKFLEFKYGYGYNEVQICITRNEVITKKELCS